MSSYPDFSSYGYSVEKELGHNRAGGRITYLATQHSTQKQVVIKDFQFAQGNSDWSAYDLVQSEVQVLKQLTHPAIPRYLDSFSTPQGFCLVQEYKNAPSLAQGRYFSLTEIQAIAKALLKVLVYLQSQNPPIIHRDLKPENILVDRSSGKIQVYLIDFGFARLGSDNLAVSSVVKGTLGFMPPEQIFNRQLTLASDLYSLGVTLVCLLTRTSSQSVGELIDENFQISLKDNFPKLPPSFQVWLAKMIAPNLNNRYKNAKSALHSLEAASLQHRRPIRIHIPGYVVTSLTALLVVKAGLSVVESTQIPVTPVSEPIPVNIESNPAVSSPSPSTPPKPVRQPTIQDKLKAAQLYEQAKRDLSNQDYHQALSLLEQATNYNPAYFEAWSDRCWSLFQLERHSEAILSCEQALKLNQSDKRAWLRYGRALHRTGSYHEAITAYDLALQIDPQYYWGWNNKSISFNKLGQHEEALRHADRAIQLNREISNAWYAKCWALRGLGRYAQAIPNCDRAIAITPNGYWYLYEKGRIFYEMKQYSEAIRYFDQAIRQNSQEPWSWYYKARSFDKLQRKSEAKQAYNRVLAIDPYFTQAQTRLDNL